MCRLAILVAVFGMIVGCSKNKSSESDIATPQLNSSGPPEVAQEPYRLETLAILAKTYDGTFGGKRVVMQSSWVPTVKLVRQESCPLPKCADDLWVWCVYVSGSPPAKDVLALMDRIELRRKPTGSTFQQTSDNSHVHNKVFRFAKDSFDLVPVTPNQYSEKFDRLAFSVLLAPDKQEERWRGGATSEISFPISASTETDRLTKVILGQANPFEDRGVAAISLCGFEAAQSGSEKFVPLSKPLVLNFLPENRPVKGAKP